MSKWRLLDLFSGIGGFSKGLEDSGNFETVAFCEIEDYPRRVLRKHWPKVPIYDDIRTLTAARLAADGIGVDAICGGFPCTDVSSAAYSWGRAGIEGERSGLFSEIVRLAGDLRPEIILMENVAELLSDGLWRVLGEFAAIGYDAEWRVIPGWLVGSPQARPRVWIAAYPAGKRKQGFLQSLDFSQIGQGWACRQEDLPAVYADPLRSDRWPQPLVCRGDNRPPHWVDRITACGNAIIPQIPEIIGRAIGPK